MAVDFLEWSFYGNPLGRWLIAVGVGVVAYAALVLVHDLLLRQLGRLSARSTTGLDNLAVGAVGATRWWFRAVVAIWIATHLLVLPEGVRDRLGTLTALVTLAQIGIWGAVAVREYVEAYSQRKLADDPASVTTIRALGFLATVLVWIAVFLVALDNLGIRVTAMVAGLGIGGVAIALAVQNILGDLFASLSIVLDKPFNYGDFIVVGDMSGTVEKVGLKTTRVRSLSGEQLIFSNSDLLQSRVRNFKRMYERRVAFTLGVVYRTTREQMEAIPGTIREIIEKLPDTRFDRAHFMAFAASSLDIEVVYYVLSPDYTLYMDRQQAINLAIMDAFNDAGIEFAFPTRTMVMESLKAES